MGRKAAVFCANGLGCGVNCLVLSNNLQLNGFEVHTFQNLLGSLQAWFPQLPIYSYPTLDELPKILQSYDWYYVVWNEKDEFIRRLVAEGKRRFPERMKILYLDPSPKILQASYYADCGTDPFDSIAKNMIAVCEKILHLPKITKSNGFIAPLGLHYRKYPNRVLIHPTGYCSNHNWEREKFVKLALHLKKEGFIPVIIPAAEELDSWKALSATGLEIAYFESLDELAKFTYESGYHIGNESGFGHLSSSLGIQTMMFFRKKKVAKMWAPSFVNGVVLTPSSLIPNIRGFRLRDRYWSKFISVDAALRGFEKLVHLAP